MKPVYINHAAVSCSLGTSLSAVAEKLFVAHKREDLLTVTDTYSPGRKLPLGLVEGPLQTISSEEDSRNNRLLATTVNDLTDKLDELKGRYGPSRIGVVLGTSTSGIAEAEDALQVCDGQGEFAQGYSYKTQEFSAPARFLVKHLGLTGPCWVVSTACTSGGKALTSAYRLLQLGVCDAVVAGGVDTLCQMTVAGFSSLNVTTETVCNPFSVNRDGINIGEGAGIFILSREPGPVRLAGFGETSDAYHISSPDPQGTGALAAMAQALKMAGIDAPAIDYINLHGTATEQNDVMENRAVNTLFGESVACGSTKSMTGHTLAAAGALEALFCWLTLQREDSLLPCHLWDGCADPAMLPMRGLAQRALADKAQYAMSNSFAFGGNNLSLILARE